MPLVFLCFHHFYSFSIIFTIYPVLLRFFCSHVTPDMERICITIEGGLILHGDVLVRSFVPITVTSPESRFATKSFRCIMKSFRYKVVSLDNKVVSLQSGFAA